MSSNEAKKQSCQAVLTSDRGEMAEARVPESAQMEAERQGMATLKGAAKP
ncbi:MAG TPA: hypothetical protein VNE63_16630 [Candidatus Acidoferrales bacterium]|nr:hypothetical protein [Candidatus Acidoferrales bacterium]